MSNINVLFTGDFAPCRKFEAIVIDKKSQVFGDALPIIEMADFSFVNLECPLTTHTQAIDKSGPALRANPLCIEALEKFSLVGLANNHILDYGYKGLSDTISVCNSRGLPTVGAGMSLKEARNFYIQDVKGLKIAIIALAEHEFNQSEAGKAGSAPINLIDNYQQIKQAKQKADIVIVTIHGGNEYFPYPRPGLRKICQHYIDLGVEAVICHHPHVTGAYEYYQGKPIMYSLGNLVFDHIEPPKGWNTGVMASLSIDAEKKQFNSLELIPYKQSVELEGVQLLKGNEKSSILALLGEYSKKMENSELWLEEWHSFIKKQADSYIQRLFFPFSFRGLGFLARNTPIGKVFFNRRNSLAKINLLRCQSHLELLIASLEARAKYKGD